MLHASLYPSGHPDRTRNRGPLNRPWFSLRANLAIARSYRIRSASSSSTCSLGKRRFRSWRTSTQRNPPVRSGHRFITTPAPPARLLRYRQAQRIGIEQRRLQLSHLSPSQPPPRIGPVGVVAPAPFARATNATCLDRPLDRARLLPHWQIRPPALLKDKHARSCRNRHSDNERQGQTYKLGEVLKETCPCFTVLNADPVSTAASGCVE